MDIARVLASMCGSGPNVFPVDIGYSALMESGYSSAGAPATNATIALGWKPTAVSTAPLIDMTGHYALTIRKVGSTITVWKGATELDTYGGSVGSTYAELVNNVLTYYGGAEEGYYSRLAIVEDSLDYSSFWEASEFVTGLWIPKNISGLSVHTLLDFSNAADLGEDSSGNGNDWTITGTQTEDTPTNNACVLNALDPNAGTLSGGNLTLASGTAKPTLQPESGQWYYEKDGVGVSYDADVSGRFEPDLTAGTYNFGATAWNDSGPTGGEKPICAVNLPDPTILRSSTVTDIVLREGTGAAASVDSLLFTPDFVNGKDRDNSRSWALFDSENSATKYLSTDSTAALATDANSLTSFDANGYSLGTSSVMNHSGASFIDLCLKAGVDQGFEVVPYTGTGVARTVSHNLGKAPTFMIVKNLDAADSWQIYHTALGATKYLEFDNGVAATDSGRWNDTAPTSTVFSIGADDEVNTSGEDYIACLFTDSDIFKAFSYTGNGSTDGPFVNLGGRPLAISFLKQSDGTNDWRNMDAVRDPFNTGSAILEPNTSDAELSIARWNMASQGIKLATTSGDLNDSGSLFVGLAIMQSVAKYSNAF